MLGEEISSTPPSQKTPLLNSVLKLLRNFIWAEAEEIAMGGEISSLSLTPF
jgi:hypothetical protein